MKTNEVIKNIAEIMTKTFPNVRCRIGILDGHVRVKMEIVVFFDKKVCFDHIFRCPTLDRLYPVAYIEAELRKAVSDLLAHVATSQSWT